MCIKKVFENFLYLQFGKWYIFMLKAMNTWRRAIKAPLSCEYWISHVLWVNLCPVSGHFLLITSLKLWYFCQHHSYGELEVCQKKLFYRAQMFSGFWNPAGICRQGDSQKNAFCSRKWIVKASETNDQKMIFNQRVNCGVDEEHFKKVLAVSHCQSFLGLLWNGPAVGA